MIFNTWSFALFALIVLPLYWLAIPRNYKPHFLVLAGSIFYACSIPGYLLLIAILSLITYGTAHLVIPSGATKGRVVEGARKAIVAAGIALIVATLAYFKYAGFLALTIDQVARHNIVPIPHIIVPLAISFFTFEFVHVLVDAYLGKIETFEPLDFAVFAMFFPTLVAGPIKRYQQFAPQLHEIEKPGRSVFALNAYRVLLGLAKKTIVADSMTVLIAPLSDPTGLPYGRLDYAVAVLAYGIKIYFDFSGYSDIAIGLSGLLGLKVPENFDRPYWAENVATFWRRWHISLSSWVRDYVFVPLGGSRGAPALTALNLVIAMALVGLWHGAAWTFVVWGLWHGLGLAVHRGWSSAIVPRIAWLQTGGPFVRALSIASTFAFVSAGWIVFGASSLDSAGLVIHRLILP